jgi:hypothetical protein
MIAPDTRHPRRFQAEIPLIELPEFGQPPLWTGRNDSMELWRRIVKKIDCHEWALLCVNQTRHDDSRSAGDIQRKSQVLLVAPRVAAGHGCRSDGRGTGNNVLSCGCTSNDFLRRLEGLIGWSRGAG